MSQLDSQNNNVFRSHNCNLSLVLKMSKKIFHETVLFNKSNNLYTCLDFAGSTNLSTCKTYKVKHWDPPEWLA